MERLFGTDGIRGSLGNPPVDGASIWRLAYAWGTFLKESSKKEDGFVVLGRDTRQSGEMLSLAIASGLMHAGLDVKDAGVIPTPAVAVLTRIKKALGGAVISASHNPFSDNGIKFFNGEGFKLKDSEEELIERNFRANTSFAYKNIGSFSYLENALEDYLDFLFKSLSDNSDLKGLKLVLDTANGAMYKAAPKIFKDLGAKVFLIGDKPDGLNINKDLGSENTEELILKVLELKADAGFAFDGDGDRLIAVDNKGEVLDGDTLLAIFANALRPLSLVSTVMSNPGLLESLEKAGVTHSFSRVGDRKVMELMLKTGASIGGENSGHLIFLNPHCTGDGLFAALKLAKLCKKTPLSELRLCIKKYPQILINIPVSSKKPFEDIPEIGRAVKKAEEELKGKGRILLRYSGTENICRLMVEAASKEKADKVSEDLGDLIKNLIGKKE